MRLRPRICPVISYPLAYGGTLLRETLRKEGRLLPLPPIYYFTPLPSHRTKHYSPAEFYAGLIAVLRTSIALRIVAARLTSGTVAMRLMHVLRSFAIARYLRELRAFQAMLLAERSVARFADGDSAVLPAHFDRLLDGRLGRYAALLDSAARHYLGPD
jgi:hypothetical protein